MKYECLICGAPLKYLENDELTLCATVITVDSGSASESARRRLASVL